MTIDEIKKLSNRELDARLAEKVLGQIVFDDHGYHFTHPATVPTVYGPGCPALPEYSQSRDAIAPLEEKTIGEVGPVEYANRLSDAITGKPAWTYQSVTASARHRAEAILLCWETDSLNGRT